MIEKLISFSIKNKFLVLMAALFLTLGSYWSMKNTPLDAIPDLSPPLVIVQLNWAGQSPEIIEDQGTYPLVSQFLVYPTLDPKEESFTLRLEVQNKKHLLKPGMYTNITMNSPCTNLPHTSKYCSDQKKRLFLCFYSWRV